MTGGPTIDNAVRTVGDVLSQKNPSAEDQARAADAVVQLVGGFLTDVRRAADAMEKLAEVTVSGIDVDELAAREQRDERHVDAVAKLADLVDQLVQTNRSIG